MGSQRTSFYIVRHGQSYGNANAENGIFIEKTTHGSDLTEKGIQQIKDLVNRIKHVAIDAIYSSHLLRAKRTAEIIANEKQLPVHIKETFQERVKGSLHGKSEHEVKQEFPFVFGDPKQLSDEEMFDWKLFDDMETAKETVERFTQELQSLSQIHSGQTVLIVTHGNLMRSFLVHIGYGSFKQLGHGTVTNGAYIKIETDGTSYEVIETHGVKI